MMSETKRLALIQLCGTHEFSNSEIASAKNSNFVRCKKGCPLEWAEAKDGKSPFKFDIAVRMVD